MAEPTAKQTKKRVLFVDPENSLRSQMAEALTRMLGRDRVEALSAGVQAAGAIDPRAVEAMGEKGYDLSTHASKSIADLPRGLHFDAIVAMDAAEAGERIPARLHEEWDIPDPAGPDPAAQDASELRDAIEHRVNGLLVRLARIPARPAAPSKPPRK